MSYTLIKNILGDLVAYVSGTEVHVLNGYAIEVSETLPSTAEGTLKDSENGYPGLTSFKLNLKNSLGSIVSWLSSLATAAREWKLPDKSGTIALTNDTSLLGYAQSSVTQGGITTIVDATGLSITVDVVEGQVIKLSGYVSGVVSSVSTDRIDCTLWEGETKLQLALGQSATTGISLYASVVLTPTAGVHTYRVKLSRGTGSGIVTSYNSDAFPSYILAEVL